MQKMFRESRDLAVRHELDRLSPSSAISVGLATRGHLPELVAIARREIPGVNATEPGLAHFLQQDPESMFVFQRDGKLLGAIAFLYLNCRGHDALLLGEIDLKNPSREFLARFDEEASAIYVWALAAFGRAVVGLGNVAEYLRRPRFIDADYFAQPATKAGRDLLKAIGFEPASSFQPELWSYVRPWHRLPTNIQASNVSARSFADARH
jgi:hypothetical protein